MSLALIQALVISSEWNSGENAKGSTEKCRRALLTLPWPSIPDAGHFKLPTSIISGQYYPFLGFLLTVRE